MVMTVPATPIGHSRREAATDESLFGWDPTPGIVSVWADREGQAIVWRRIGEGVQWSRERFRPWLFATSLDDLAHRGPTLVAAESPDEVAPGITYRELDGRPGSYRYLLSAPRSRMLEEAIRAGATQRLGRPNRHV
jgi:DNA polymerase, archaea type